MTLATLLPGLARLRASTRAGLVSDARAGLAVAAISIPTAVAFTSLMNLPPQAGLHASILPLVAYALLGPSPRLVVGPDTATCVLVAGSLTALGVSDPEMRLAFAGVLAVLAGIFCIGAGLLRLGAMADFLAWPILVGFLNGVAIDLMLGGAKANGASAWKTPPTTSAARPRRSGSKQSIREKLRPSPGSIGLESQQAKLSVRSSARSFASAATLRPRLSKAPMRE